MNTPLTARPQWDIDRLLAGLIDANVRVAAKAFSPMPRNGKAAGRFVPVRNLYLPDNSRADGLPVFFEGRLGEFDRQIGVVFARLDAPTATDAASEGQVLFRGKTAVILRGPALVELAFPFQVERLPADAENYWRDFRSARVQFEFPFGAGPNGHQTRLPGSRAKKPALESRPWDAPIDLKN
jgi:hypothetical protein